MAPPFRSIFGKLEIRLDPWQPEFGPEFAGIVDAPASEQGSVDAQFERPAATWGAVDPTGFLPNPHRIYPEARWRSQSDKPICLCGSLKPRLMRLFVRYMVK